jgi:hypothetical protein
MCGYSLVERASRANKKSQRSRVSQYIPRVSRRRITGMSNTIHTFMHALQVRWRVKLGCSLAFANPILLPALLRASLGWRNLRACGGRKLT